MSFHDLTRATRRALAGHWWSTAFKLALLSLAIGLSQLVGKWIAVWLAEAAPFGRPLGALVGLAVSAVLAGLELTFGAEILLARASDRSVALDRAVLRVGPAILTVVLTAVVSGAPIGIVAVLSSVFVSTSYAIVWLVAGLSLVGAWICLRCSFAIYWVLDGASAIEALTASFRLTRDHAGLCRAWLVSAVAVGLGVVISAWALNRFFAPAPYVSNPGDGTLAFALIAVGSVVATIAATVFFGTAHAMTYARLRPVTWAESHA